MVYILTLDFYRRVKKVGLFIKIISCPEFFKNIAHHLEEYTVLASRRREYMGGGMGFTKLRSQCNAHRAMVKKQRRMTYSDKNNEVPSLGFPIRTSPDRITGVQVRYALFNSFANFFENPDSDLKINFKNIHELEYAEELFLDSAYDAVHERIDLLNKQLPWRLATNSGDASCSFVRHSISDDLYLILRSIFSEFNDSTIVALFRSYQEGVFPHHSLKKIDSDNFEDALHATLD